MSLIGGQDFHKRVDTFFLALDDLDEMTVRVGEAAGQITLSVISDRRPEDFIELFEVIRMERGSASINRSDEVTCHGDGRFRGELP